MSRRITHRVLLLLTPVWMGCKSSAPVNSLGIVRENSVIDVWIDPDARIEPMAEGLGEITGMAWSPLFRYMIIADRKNDVLWKYSEGKGLSVYFKPAGRPDGVEYDSLDRLVIHRETGVVRLDKSGQTRPLEQSPPRRPYLLDLHGFQWTIADGVVALLDADGNPAGHLQIPEPVVSFCWGDDGSSVYFSTKTAIYRVRTYLVRAEDGK